MKWLRGWCSRTIKAYCYRMLRAINSNSHSKITCDSSSTLSFHVSRTAYDLMIYCLCNHNSSSLSQLCPCLALGLLRFHSKSTILPTRLSHNLVAFRRFLASPWCQSLASRSTPRGILHLANAFWKWCSFAGAVDAGGDWFL